MATLSELQARLTLYESALEKALMAEGYSVAGRSVNRAKVEDLQKQINILEARIARKTGKSSTFVPVFNPYGG